MTASEQPGIKKLGFGFMRLPLVNGNFEQIDQKTLCAMVDHFLKKGFRYFDTAWFYHNGHPEVDFVQLQLNHLDWESDAIQSRKCYETASRHGKPVIVMEPVKGGTLASIPEKAEQCFRDCRPEMSAASWAIRFAAGLENVMVVLSGMSTLKQVEDNTSYMENFAPLSQQERSVVQEVTGIINGSVTIPCTGCSYCTNGCPMNIAIPRYFSLYNAEMRESEDKSWMAQLMLYGHLSEQFGKASECISCGSCEEMCPQHLPIREWLKAVARKFEKV